MPLGSVANKRLRHMQIGYARGSKVDGSRSLDRSAMYCRPPQRRSMAIRMALIVSVVLAILTGGCFKTTPTSTGVLDRSFDPDLWPWTVEAVQVECWGDGMPGQANFFSVLVEGRRMVPAQAISGWHVAREAARVDLLEPLYAEARRICGAT